MKTPALPLLILATFALLLSGCGAPKWWVGSWVLDQAHTADQYKIAKAQEREAKPVEGTGIGEIFSNLLSGASEEIVLSQLSGISLTITEKEFSLLKNGAGTAQTYEVMEKPEAGKVVIKQADGTVLTLTKEGEHLTLVPARGVPIRLYFLKLAK